MSTVSLLCRLVCVSVCVSACRTLVAALPRDYAATADPYLGHTVGPITGYGVSRSLVCSCCLTSNVILLARRMLLCVSSSCIDQSGKCQTPLHGHRLRIVMLYNTTNGGAHNNSTTWCTTNSPPTDKNLPHPKSQHLNMSRCWALALRCGEFVVQQVVELLWACPLVVLYNIYVAGVRVVEFGTK